jgi:hypothetical protein
MLTDESQKPEVVNASVMSGEVIEHIVINDKTFAATINDHQELLKLKRIARQDASHFQWWK